MKEKEWKMMGCVIVNLNIVDSAGPVKHERVSL